MAVLQLTSWAFGLAPSSSSSLTHSTFPVAAAQCRGCLQMNKNLHLQRHDAHGKSSGALPRTSGALPRTIGIRFITLFSVISFKSRQPSEYDGEKINNRMRPQRSYCSIQMICNKPLDCCLNGIGHGIHPKIPISQNEK